MAWIGRQHPAEPRTVGELEHHPGAVDARQRAAQAGDVAAFHRGAGQAELDLQRGERGVAAQIRRRARAGGLDLDSYRSWYAALIDLSLRLSGLGWRNVLCETAFVARGGTASRDWEARALAEAGMRLKAAAALAAGEAGLRPNEVYRAALELRDTAD